jgi:hypothetical protein
MHEGTRLTDCRSPADGDVARPQEGNGKCHDIGGDVAYDHDISRVWRDEFG